MAGEQGKLSLQVVADAKGLASGFDDVLGQAKKLGSDLQDVAGDASKSFTGKQVTGGLSQSGGEIRATMAGMGQQMAAALSQGMAPMRGMAAIALAQTDKMGGSFTKLAQRIDLQMKTASGFTEKELKRQAWFFKQLGTAGIAAASSIAAGFASPLTVPLSLVLGKFSQTAFPAVGIAAREVAAEIGTNFRALAANVFPKVAAAASQIATSAKVATVARAKRVGSSSIATTALSGGCPLLLLRLCDRVHNV